MYSAPQGFPGGSVIKNPSASEGDTRDAVLIRGSGKLPGVENGNPLQHSYLKNSMDRGALWATVHRVTKSQTRQSVHTHTHSAPGGELCTHTHTHSAPGGELCCFTLPWPFSAGSLFIMGASLTF